MDTAAWGVEPCAARLGEVNGSLVVVDRTIIPPSAARWLALPSLIGTLSDGETPAPLDQLDVFPLDDAALDDLLQERPCNNCSNRK